MYVLNHDMDGKGLAIEEEPSRLVHLGRCRSLYLDKDGVLFADGKLINKNWLP
jgi:hypothetical protein